jgi:hypothetical protein
MTLLIDRLARPASPRALLRSLALAASAFPVVAMPLPAAWAQQVSSHPVDLSVEYEPAPPAPAPPSAPPPPGPPNTRLLGVQINAGHGAATLSFEGIGTVAGFECKLVRQVGKGRGRHAKAPSFKACQSPKAYRGLKSGHYLFEARTVGPGGRDKSPARLKFTITRRTRR